MNVLTARSCRVSGVRSSLPQPRRHASNRLHNVMKVEIEQDVKKRGLPLNTVTISKDDISSAEREKFERDFSHFKTGYERPFLKAWYVLQQGNSPFSGSKMVLGVTEQERREAFERYGEPEILSEGIEIKPPVLIPEDKMLAEVTGSFQ